LVVPWVDPLHSGFVHAPFPVRFICSCDWFLVSRNVDAKQVSIPQPCVHTCCACCCCAGGWRLPVPAVWRPCLVAGPTVGCMHTHMGHGTAAGCWNNAYEEHLPLLTGPCDRHALWHGSLVSAVGVVSSWRGSCISHSVQAACGSSYQPLASLSCSWVLLHERMCM
jgi:hypothetical protein